MELCGLWKEKNVQHPLTTFRCEEYIVQTRLWGLGFLVFTTAQGRSESWV